MEQLYGAVDIGGTKIMIAVVDQNGNIRGQKTIKTLELDVSLTMLKIISTLKEQCALLNKSLHSLLGIGIVCAGPVNLSSQTVENPYTLPGWEHYPIVKVLAGYSGLPVKLENDVNGALLGEIFLRKITKQRVFMLAFGTGIGGAFFEQGHLYRAGNGFHPELGHMVVDIHEKPCYCGKHGCFESLWSGSALHKRAKLLGFQDFNDLYKAWKLHDPIATHFIKKISTELQTAIWNIGIVFKLDLLILGGGLMNTYFPFAKEIIEESLDDKDDFVPPFKILQADAERNPALIGAMLLISETLK